MWRAVSEKKLNYIRGLEEKTGNTRLLNGLTNGLLLLVLALLLTRVSQLRAVDVVKQRNTMEPFLALLDPGAVSGLSLAEKLQNLKLGFYFIYGAECVLAVASYICFRYSICSRNKAYFGNPMIMEDGVCTAKREIFALGPRNAYISAKTPDGEVFENIFVPWISSREMGRGTPVLLTVGNGSKDEGLKFRAYPPDLDEEVHL